MKRLLIGLIVVFMIPFSALSGAAAPRVLEHLTPHIDERCYAFLTAEQVQAIKDLIANKRSYLPTAVYEAISVKLQDADFLSELEGYAFPFADSGNLMTLFDRAAYKLPYGADYSVLNEAYNHAAGCFACPESEAFAKALVAFQAVVDAIDAPFLCSEGAGAAAETVAAVPVSPGLAAVVAH